MRTAKEAKWTDIHLITEIQKQMGGSRLLAYRRANGWTQEEVAAKLREIYFADTGETSTLSHRQVSKWEKGHDRPQKYLDALCRLYSTRANLLGFGKDFGGEAEAPVAAPDVPRREAIRMVAGVAAAQPLAELERVRLRLAGVLPGPDLSAHTQEHWDTLVAHFGEQIRFQDPAAFIEEAKTALDQLCDLYAQPLSLTAHHSLGKLIAKVAGLIAIDCNAIGDTRQMLDWFHFAQIAAEECDNGKLKEIRPWAISYEAMTFLWHNGNPKRALELAQRALRLAPEGSPNAPLASSIAGRSYARLGESKLALANIDAAEKMWERLEASKKGQSTFFFYEHLLRMYQSDVYTVLGHDFARAYEVQQRAILLAPPGPMDIDTALVRLDRAICLAKQKEPVRSRDEAMEVVRQMPAGFRQGTAAQKVKHIMHLIKAQGDYQTAASFEEMLRAVS